MTEIELRHLTKKAIQGDKDANKQLYQYNAMLAKRANSRMSALEKKNLDYYAYDRASIYNKTIGLSNRFTTSSKKLGGAGGIARNIRELETFLNAESSTVTGHRNIRERRLTSFRAIGLDIEQDKETEDAFLRFLGSESVQEVFEILGNSDFVKMMASFTRKKNDIKKLERQFKAFIAGEKSYDQILDYMERGIKKNAKLDRDSTN